MNSDKSWTYIAIDKVAHDRRSGVAISPSNFVNDGFPVIHKGDVHPGGIINLTPRNSRYVDNAFAVSNSGAIVDSRYLVVALRDLVPEAPQLGLICLLKPNEKALLAQGTYAFQINTNMIDPLFMVFLSNAFDYRKTIQQRLVGSTQVHLRSTEFFQIKIPIPEILEQKRISQAIDDINQLINSLSRLIAKKKAIKQGVMQELLTGKRRLPGFSEKWDKKKLGTLLNYEQPTKYLVKDTEYSDSNNIPVLTAGKTFVLGYTSEETGIFRNLPVIIFDDFTTATKYVDFPFKAKSSAMKMLMPRSKNISLKFVFEKIQLIDFMLGDHKRYWISEYQEIEIDIPKFAEQTAIADVLSDMDFEIDYLEKELTKYCLIKTGMMQQLLTGKIRIYGSN